MKFLKHFAFVVFSAVFFEHVLAEEQKPEDAEIRTKRQFSIVPKPHSYSMQIREFHECVSCNVDRQAQIHFASCLRGLSHQNQHLYQSCCEKNFDAEFCRKASSPRTEYEAICKISKKGLEAERCFWKGLQHKKGADIESFRLCKKQILSKYCTSESAE